MKATGIIRRIDDLGRVVIPKEIRQSMRMKEGTPLELFTTHDGNVVLKVYRPYAEVDFEKAYSMIKIITKYDFAIYTTDDTCIKRTKNVFPMNLTKTTDESHFIVISDEYDDLVCTVAVDPDMPELERKQIEQIIAVLLQE